PALDNDDYRRGKPTCHKVFGEAMAILAGDALLTHSYYILSNMQKVSDLIKVKIIKEISNAAGFAGMVGGQVVDIESEGKSLPDKDTLNYIHSHKTGALITASVRCGALLAKASKDKLELLTVYGKSLGLAFQIVDDLLDEVGDEKKMGKRVQKDASLKKLTYPTLYGLQESKHKVEELYKEAINAITPFGEKKSMLELLAKIIVKRDY
ncbi:MAG: polyprenyl synthetase family protein, partial [Firmicutes bacterium]|nr:polyprenyl synthetase family protein [Bacillota bacterium]